MVKSIKGQVVIGRIVWQHIRMDAFIKEIAPIGLIVSSLSLQNMN